MSKKDLSQAGVGASLQDVRVDVFQPKARRHTHGPVAYDAVVPKVPTNNFVYVNSAYVGSLNSISEGRPQQPPTSVIREQYWACSKWPQGQRILAIAVGVLLGAVIGLIATLVINGGDTDNIIGGIFRTSKSE